MYIHVYGLIDIQTLYYFVGIYEVFVGHKNFAIGKQPDLLAGTETVSLITCNDVLYVQGVNTIDKGLSIPVNQME